MRLVDLARVVLYPECLPIYRLQSEDKYKCGNDMDIKLYKGSYETVGEYLGSFTNDNFLKYGVKFLVIKEKR